MRAKEYLSQVFVLERRVTVENEKIMKLRSLMDYRSPSYSRNGTRSQSEALTDMISKVSDYENSAVSTLNKLINAYIEIEKVISDVDDDIQREILERRYLLYQPWVGFYDKYTEEYVKSIPEIMHYSPQHIYKLHGKALEAVDKLLSGKIRVNKSEKESG